jgi:hypothetical protein
MPVVAWRSLPSLGIAAVLCATAAGCGPKAGRRGAPPATATIAFVNQSLEEVSVYAVGTSGDWYRTGTVMPGQTGRLRIPASLVGSGRAIHFAARPLATSRVATSGPLTLVAGDTYTITLPTSQNTLNVLPGLP